MPTSHKPQVFCKQGFRVTKAIFCLLGKSPLRSGPRKTEVHRTSCALGRSLFSIIRNNCLCILFYNKVSCSNGYASNIDCLASLQSSGISLPATRSHSPFLNTLAIDNPIEYARLALAGEMQAWVDVEDSSDVW